MMHDAYFEVQNTSQNFNHRLLVTYRVSVFLKINDNDIRFCKFWKTYFPLIPKRFQGREVHLFLDMFHFDDPFQSSMGKKMNLPSCILYTKPLWNKRGEGGELDS